MTTSVYRVSLTEGNDYWEIGTYPHFHRAEFEAEEFIKRIPHPERGTGVVEVHELTPFDDGTGWSRRRVKVLNIASRGRS
jgi:hypothetical protein